MSIALSQLHDRDRVNIVEPGRLHPAVSFARASTATYMGSDGLLHTAAVNAPRYEYDRSGNYLGLLIEEARTNITPYSSAFDNAAWTKTNTTVTPNAAVAPDGTTTACTVSNTPNLSSFLRQTQSFTAGLAYTSSVYVKYISGANIFALEFTINSATQRATFNILAGTVALVSAGITAMIVPVGNGVFRCIVSTIGAVSGTSNAPNLYIGAYGSTPTATTFMVWGLQNEVGAFATSYIPTTSAAVTRSADIAQITTPVTAIGYNGSEGTVYAEFNGGLESTQGVNGRVVSSNTSVALLGTASRVQISSWDGTYAINKLLTGVDIPTTMVKAAVGYSATAGTKSITGNGVTPTSSTQFTNFNSPTALGIGKNQSGATNMLNGHIRWLTYYPRRLPDSELIRMTT